MSEKSEGQLCTCGAHPEPHEAHHLGWMEAKSEGPEVERLRSELAEKETEIETFADVLNDLNEKLIGMEKGADAEAREGDRLRKQLAKRERAINAMAISVDELDSKLAETNAALEWGTSKGWDVLAGYRSYCAHHQL